MEPQELPATEFAATAANDAELRAALSAVQEVETVCRDAFLPLLRRHGIVRVEVHYDGGGDEGSVCDVNAYDAEGAVALPPILCDHHSLEYNGQVTNWTIALEDALSGFAENAVCARHKGWEDGEGAYGTVAIDVASGAVTITHNHRFIDYETVQTEL
jgi:hypothetical protein